MTLASDYADSLIRDILANDAAGTPFGVVSDDNPVTDLENGEEVSAYDYLSDVLDIAYTVGSDGVYRSARVLITFGGPNAWLDTRTSELEVFWDGTAKRYLPRAFVDALDAALEELWASR